MIAVAELFLFFLLIFFCSRLYRSRFAEGAAVARKCGAQGRTQLRAEKGVFLLEVSYFLIFFFPCRCALARNRRAQATTSQAAPRAQPRFPRSPPPPTRRPAIPASRRAPSTTFPSRRQDLSEKKKFCLLIFALKVRRNRDQTTLDDILTPDVVAETKRRSASSRSQTSDSESSSFLEP